MAKPINVVIDKSRFQLATAAGDLALVWGDSSNSQTPFNPQALPTQEVIISVDSTDGAINIILPPCSEQPSNFVKLWIGKVSDDDNVITVNAFAENTINGASRLSMHNINSWALFENLNGTNWTCRRIGE